MIRKKAKGLLLCFMLCVASLCFFACKEEKPVINVDSISFKDEQISLLVGEEYVPEVIVLPSYANVRSYKLESNDKTALKVEGSKIVALKEAVGVKLKVVSDQNSNINDVISVSIYSEATQLDTPTQLSFNGEKFTFAGKDNANAYALKINGFEINIGNTTEYLFENIINKMGDLHNQVVACSVKAIGDGKVFEDSRYSEEIKFVKLSHVKNAYIEDEKLYFDAIENVLNYNIVEKFGTGDFSRIIENPNYAQTKLSVDVSALTDSENGRECRLVITPDRENYKNPDVKVFGGEALEVSYTSLGKVKNVAINDKVITWDFVKNAKTYTIEIFKGNNLYKTYADVEENTVLFEGVEAGNYSCRVIANSSSPNTTSGKLPSSDLQFEILATPVIEAKANNILWNRIANATGYVVNIKNRAGENMANKVFVPQTEQLEYSYDVGAFTADTYYMDIFACGNGKDKISSSSSLIFDWHVLQPLQVKVENEHLIWQDFDEESPNSYYITYGNVEKLLTSGEYEYDSESKTFSYNLSAYNFEQGTHEIKLQSIGNGKEIFDSKESLIEIIKLADSEIMGFNDNRFSASRVQGAVRYEIKIYNDLIVEQTLEGNSSLQFKLNAEELEAGNYTAKVFVYGNGSNIFDANNKSESMGFAKLEIPTIKVDYANLRLYIENHVDGQEYNWYKDGQKINGEISHTLDLTSLTSGEYQYSVKAIGRILDTGLQTLDSKVTEEGDQTSVKKLATPTINFDKQQIRYTINCEDKDFVGEYVLIVKHGDSEQSVSSNTVGGNVFDYSMDNSGEYVASAYVKPKQTTAGYGYEDKYYDLVMASASVSHTATKLESGGEIAVEKGNIIFTPSEALKAGTGYSLVLRIAKSGILSEDIVLDNFSYNGTRFSKALLNSTTYSVEESGIEQIMNGAGEYDVYATIYQSNASAVSSFEQKATNKLKVLGKVVNIRKVGQSILFDPVATASGYIAVINLEAKDYYIDVTEKINVSTPELNMADLLELMNGKIAYKEDTQYQISFIAYNQAVSTLANKGEEKYSFKFLPMPEIDVEEDEFSKKHLSIANVDNASLYNLIISQEGNEKLNENLTKATGETTRSLENSDFDTDKKLAAGEVKIQVKAIAESGNYFASKYKEITAIKLAAPEIQVINGLLQWNIIEGAKEYNLSYSNSEQGVVKLVVGEVVEGFNMGENCIYNFDALNAGETTIMSLQVNADVEAGHYLNSEIGVKRNDIYKLPTPILKISEGELVVELDNNYIDRVGKIEVFVGETEFDITGEGVVKEETNLITSYTIDPNKLLKYGDADGILLDEIIRFKLYSKNDSTLNSSVKEKVVGGLLMPTNLHIITSNNQENDKITEVLETINWTNPSANSIGEVNQVESYEIIITYEGQDCKFASDTNSLVMPKFYDENKNGVFDENSNDVWFGAGEYSIKVRSRALTNGNDKFLNSKYSDSITITILGTPKKVWDNATDQIITKHGEIVWKSVDHVGYYLVKVYKIKGYTPTLFYTTKAYNARFDLSTVPNVTSGIYGIVVQAMHDAPNILAGGESEMFEVLNLPAAETYYVKDGALYIRLHCFYNKVEIILTETGTDNPRQHVFIMPNNDEISIQIRETFTSVLDKWSTQNPDVYETFTNEGYYNDVKFEDQLDPTLVAALADNYTLSVRLHGNTADAFAIATGVEAINLNNTTINENSATKLETPSVEVSSTTRGRVEAYVGGSYETLKYYDDGETSLQGVHLYEVTIDAKVVDPDTGLVKQKSHVMYVAEIVEEKLFVESFGLNYEEGQSPIVIKTIEGKALKYVTFANDATTELGYENGITINIIDKVDTKDKNGNDVKRIPFDFSVNKYIYYTPNAVNIGETDVKQHSDIVLTNGGAFTVTARFLGDSTQFLQSNLSVSKKISKYNPITISANSGAISWLNQATEDDEPAYIITITGGINGKESYNLVLHKAGYGEEDIKDLASCLDPNKQYIWDTINYSADTSQIIYRRFAQIIEEQRKLAGKNEYAGGTFTLDIKTQFTSKTDMSKIMAQEGTKIPVNLLPKTDIKIEDGTLSWDMVYIAESNNKLAYNYNLEVFKGGTNVCSLQLKQGQYRVIERVKNGKRYYVAQFNLPQAVGAFKFDAGVDYTFKLTTLGIEYVEDTETATSYIDSTSTQIENIKILPQIAETKMQNGALVWKAGGNTGAVEVKVWFMLGDSKISGTDTINTTSYILPKELLTDNLSKYKTETGNDYKIELRLKGNSVDTLSGFYTLAVTTYRLPTITGIKAQNGVLTWNTIDQILGLDEQSSLAWNEGVQKGVKYSISYTNSNGEYKTINELTENSYAFSGEESGELKNIKITAKYYGTANVSLGEAAYFDSFANEEEIKITKLNAVADTDITVTPEIDEISWKSVENADAYIVKVTEKIGDDIYKDTYSAALTDTSWKVEGVQGTSFTISVKALSYDGYINSEFSAPAKADIPVSVEKVEYNKGLKAFIWKPTGENGNSYYIRYNRDGVDSGEINVTSTVIIDGVDYYCYYPRKIGTYKDLYVYIRRAGVLQSQPTYCKDELGERYILVFDYFTSGSGVEGDEYIISNETQFRNIAHFLNAYYKLDADITLSSNDGSIITISTGTFLGSINGNGKTIKGTANINTNLTSEYQGLFAKSDGAKFENLKLSGFNLTGTLKTSSLFMGLLVGEAKNTVFNNVEVVSSTISFTNDAFGDNVNVYIGVIAGKAESSTFTDCLIALGEQANINLAIKGNSNTNINFGGLVGISKSCTISGAVTSRIEQQTYPYAFIVDISKSATSQNGPKVKVGSLVGFDDGNLSNISVENSYFYAHVSGETINKLSNHKGEEL